MCVCVRVRVCVLLCSIVLLWAKLPEINMMLCYVMLYQILSESAGFIKDMTKDILVFYFGSQCSFIILVMLLQLVWEAEEWCDGTIFKTRTEQDVCCCFCLLYTSDAADE